jgi:protoporphyrinogen oxidase
VPSAALGTVFSGLLPFADLLRVGALRLHVTSGALEQHLAEPETTTLAALRERGFSDVAIDRFFRPFLGGVFLERDLATSSRMFEFVFRMFSLGRAGLPAEGMEAIPRQLVAHLPAETVRCGMRVAEVRADGVTLADGRVMGASGVIVAAEGPEAARMVDGASIETGGLGVVTLSFAADATPVQEPVLVLDGEGRGPVNHVVVPSVLCPGYAPGGRHLVTATVLGTTLGDAELESAARTQLGEWFGADVSRWRLLRTERIAYALPMQRPPALAEVERTVRLAPGLFVCGDHRDTGSIQGAMVSGRRAADAVLASRA